MPAPSTIESDPLPLRFLVSPPTSVDEAVARGTIVAGRLVAQCWDRQRILENCAVRIQACLFGTAEQIWRGSLEACYLREPRRTERITVR